MLNDSAGMLKPEIIIEILLRRRWYLIVPFCLTMAVGIYLALFLPKSYEASTLILVEVQRVPTDYVRSIVSSDINSRINTISQQILSRTNLEKVIKRLSLYSGEAYKEMLMVDKVEAVRKRIQIEVSRDRRSRSGGPESFSITYSGKSPENVMKVVNTLASHFIDENLKVREEQASGTSDFLEGELVAMRKKLESVEEGMKKYRRRYMGELPEQLDGNLRILDRLQEQMLDRRARLSEAKGRQAVLTNTIAAATASQGDPETTTDITQLTEQLTALQAKYTERHPDIIRLKRKISSLQAKMTQTDSSSPVASSSGSLADRQALGEVKHEIGALQKEIMELQAQIKLYKQRVENTPKHEQELMGLRRDYQNIQESYSSLLRRKLEAEIAVNMEKKQKGERFRIIDSARLPEKPTSPDMQRLFLIITVLGLGIGGGIVFALEYTDTSFRRTQDIEAFLDLPVLAEVPRVKYPWDLRRERLHLAATVVSCGICFLLFAGFAGVTIIGVDRIRQIINV